NPPSADTRLMATTMAGDGVAGHFRLSRNQEVSAMTTTWPTPQSPAISVLARTEEVSAMTDLKGKACRVPGGSRGVGRAIALELGRCGASVAVGFVSNEEAAAEVAAEIATR